MAGTMGREGRVFPEYDSDGFVHNEASGFSLYMQERCKRIFFIRHAEGFHNLAERESTVVPKVNILLAENSGDKYVDAKLTPFGEQQCAKLKANIRGDTVWGFDKPLNLDLVVCSPLTRCLQTAVLSLGDPGAPGAPPFIVNELCRERIADYTCDRRRKRSVLKADFPSINFDLVKDEEDTMFLNQKEGDSTEGEAKCSERGVEFLKWLCGRPEIHIAVVTNSVFLKSLFSQFGSNLSREDQECIHKFPANAEMRSIMLCAHRKLASTKEEGEQPPSKKQKTLWNGA
uniref:Uncharacterized protein n=1 Tax=Zooxanthella nutricula TaxID=1333877 RepID=A0A7S2VQL8_9DINO|mmetsp:Transcript_93429/g.285891  ORF Transcript_93429/g.285891 Transcript_93429/m.285891 type:complete len:287 (+) Transcript_93429:107-967(+)